MRSKLSRLKTTADKLWSKIVRQGGVCAICGSQKHLNAHHIISRRFTPLRWDLKNGVCLCVLHHKFSKDAVHNNPLTIIDWFKDNTEVENYLRLGVLQKRKKITKDAINDVIKHLQKGVR